MIGTGRKQEYMVMGDTVYLASRLEDASRTEQILVRPATYKATKGVFEYRELEPISVKGKEEPIPVYELLLVKETLYRVQPGTGRVISLVMVDTPISSRSIIINYIYQFSPS